MPSMMSRRSSCGVTALDGHLYCVGGIGINILNKSCFFNIPIIINTNYFFDFFYESNKEQSLILERCLLSYLSDLAAAELESYNILIVI